MLTNRTLLFYLQSLIAILSMVIIGLILVPDFTEQVSAHLLKVTIAPFPTLSLLIFSLFVFNKVIRELDDKTYSMREILVGFLIMFSISALIFLGTEFALGIMQGIDKQIFLLSIFLGLIIFSLLRVSNLYTMAIITGMSEGVILYIVFGY